MERFEFVVSTNEEHFSGGEGFSTKEQAIAEAAEYLGLKKGDKFFVGKRGEASPPKVDTERMLEDMACNLDDNYGEVVAEGWPNASDEALKELEDAMNKTFREWHEKHASFTGWPVEDVTEHVV